MVHSTGLFFPKTFHFEKSLPLNKITASLGGWFFFPGLITVGVEPANNLVDHGFYMFSPTAYYDFYSNNNFQIIKACIVEVPKYVQNGKIKSETTLIVIKLVSIVVKNGMNILNVSLPNKM